MKIIRKDFLGKGICGQDKPKLMSNYLISSVISLFCQETLKKKNIILSLSKLMKFQSQSAAYISSLL